MMKTGNFTLNSGRQVAGPLEFLDYLARILGCEYLSDLRFRVITEKEAAGILSLDIDMFPLLEYQEAARYLLNCPAVYGTPAEARCAVVDCLRQASRP